MRALKQVPNQDLNCENPVTTQAHEGIETVVPFQEYKYQ